ncbi:cell cycle protein ftsw/roda [Lucifera butyrica]|uniref:Probable peptidoglycan glycosyltransferase FtsW n=1 Tax=Lucifera butyrica TaxID=1351585 RepID=A0A498R800_9FIRM|nr:putative peptidoglycan glycosyltransferase FtsW [Lucifera butyrica]VBB05268.1 cell cycle protein ftsw/roda [Lucifera butyrica]
MDRSLKLWRSHSEAVLVIALLLFLIGTVNIFSASFVLAGQMLHDSYYFLKRHLLAFFIGAVLLVFFAKIDYRRLVKPWPLLVMIMAVLGMLMAVHFGGVNANGARRWLKLGVQFQPSEFAKLAAILMAAAYLGPRVEKKQPITLFSWPFYFTLIMGGLVLKQPDMGTAMVIVGLCLLLYIIAGIPRHELLGLGMAGAGAVVYFIFAAAYRAERIMAWIDPWSHQQDSGYQTVQSLLAIGSGGFFGAGLGMGASKFHYLPEAHTDFAFAVLCQEMGFIGALAVILLLAALAWYGIQIALKAADGVGMIMATGIVAMIIGQAIGNAAMVSGVIPVTGIPMPFISFGGTFLLVIMAALGILISVGRRAAGIVSSAPGPEKPMGRTRLRLAGKTQQP